MSKDLAEHLYHDNFQNFKRYSIPKAQLVIADIPYNFYVTVRDIENAPTIIEANEGAN